MVLGLNSWFLNFSHLAIDRVTPQSLADIRNPYVEYGIYWLFKSAQVSSLIAGCVIHPAYRLYLLRKLTPETTTNNSTKVIRNICRRMQGRFLIGSMVASPLLTAAAIWMKGYSREDVVKRCYEIRCNLGGKLSYDRMTFCFGMIGWYWKRFQGAVDGINFALLYFIINREVLQKYGNPMLTDFVKPEQLYQSVDASKDDESELLRFAHEKERVEKARQLRN